MAGDFRFETEALAVRTRDFMKETNCFGSESDDAETVFSGSPGPAAAEDRPEHVNQIDTIYVVKSEQTSGGRTISAIGDGYELEEAFVKAANGIVRETPDAILHED